ncbi:MAG TPA: hypothetical protein VFE03_16590 [Caulobacteraceae bacterium]|jgi:hypothetical protein|nr:hypothetical protein [Caulobacteraceae bacterium]
MTRGLLALLLIFAAGPAGAWPGGYVGRLQALALIQTLRADLLTHDSATEVLTRWCADHRLADPPLIVARRVKTEAPAASAETRALLGVGPAEPLGFRHVELACGEHVLSVADNWYVSGRLTPEMNRALEITDTPFGVVVRPLNFRRRTLESRLLFQPLPEGWERGAAIPHGRGARLEFPEAVLRHTAVLSTPDGAPISVVVEDYGPGLFAFEPARAH